MPKSPESREKLKEAVARAYPQASEILVSFPDDWNLIDVLPAGQGERTALYIAALPVEPERPSRNHFAGLPAEVNLELTHYRLYRFFEPWNMPTLYVDWNAWQGKGTVAGHGPTKIQLNDMGDAQTWTGKRYGVLWECLFHSRGQERANWQERLAQVWRVVEKEMRVERIFTPGHDPEFEQSFYQEFLRGLGYLPIKADATWWSKTI